MRPEATAVRDTGTLSVRVEAFVRYLELNGESPLARVAPPEDGAAGREALPVLRRERDELAMAAEVLRAQRDALRRSEQMVEAGREQYRELFELSPEALLVTDLGAVVRSANPAALRVLDVDPTALRGRALTVCVDRDDRERFEDAVERAARGVAEVSLWIHGRSAAAVAVTLRGTAMRDGQGILWSARSLEAPAVVDRGRADELTRAVQVRDEQLARALDRCDRLEAQVRAGDAALAALAYELRGPVDVILGCTRLLRLDECDPRQRGRAVASIERNAAAQSALVDDLLDVSRTHARKLRIQLALTDVGELVAAAVDAARASAEQHAVSFTCDAPAGLTVLGDRARLAQVFANLLSNAAKFTPTGGRVDVRCGLRRGGGGRPEVTVEVTDTGCGLAPSELDHVFEFRRQGSPGGRRPAGLGLGLFLVRELVESHGGTVSAHSAGEGRGATFTVRVPAVGPQRTAFAEAPADSWAAFVEGDPAEEFVEPKRVSGINELAVSSKSDEDLSGRHARAVLDAPPAAAMQ